MGFFDLQRKQAPERDPLLKGLSVDLLHKKGCAVCPLNLQSGLRHPNMEPTGDDEPLIYMLGEAPGAKEDLRGKQFVGESGNILHAHLPSKWRNASRFNNVVRTRPPDNRTPTHVEIECCRPSIVKDIEWSKPRAIFGFGGVPLEWVTEQTGITKWAGKRIPVKIGKHKTWFFPMIHPAYILHLQRKKDRKAREMEFLFGLNMRQALAVVKKLPKPIIHTREDAVADITWVTGHNEGDLEKVLAFIQYCWHQKVVGLDYETSVLRPYMRGAKILTAALATKRRAFAWAMDHKSAGWTDRQRRVIRKAWRRFLLKAPCKKVSHHLGFELEWSAFFFGVDTAQARGWEDSMSQAFVLDERRGVHGLDYLCLQYFGLPVKDLFRMDRKRMADEKLETILEYNGVDAKYHRALWFVQRDRLREDGLWFVYRRHLRRVTAAVLTQFRGVPVHPEVVESFYDEHERTLARIEKKIQKLPIARKFHKRYGYRLRPSANQDVLKAFKKIGHVKIDSTKEEVLKTVKHPLARLETRWRKVDKLLSTYIIPVMPQERIELLKKQQPDLKSVSNLMPDGLLHPVITTTKARTTRTTSEEPNIQNWHKRGPSKYIRRVVTVQDDELIVAIDYAGIQARNVAMESRDRGLVQHYWDRYDIHGDWLDRLYRIVPRWVPPQDIGKDLDKKEKRKEERSIVKNKFVFPSFFGAIGKTVAGYLNIEERQGQRLSEEFFAEFPDVKAWHEKLHRSYKENGYVTGLSGYWRRAPIEINQLINAPIQADEAVIVCNAWDRLSKLEEQMWPIMMIHDDLTFIWKKKMLERNLERAIPLMVRQEYDWEKIVPCEVEVSIGKNWCDLKPYQDHGKYESTKNGGWREVPR